MRDRDKFVADNEFSSNNACNGALPPERGEKSGSNEVCLYLFLNKPDTLLMRWMWCEMSSRAMSGHLSAVLHCARRLSGQRWCFTSSLASIWFDSQDRWGYLWGGSALTFTTSDSFWHIGAGLGRAAAISMWSKVPFFLHGGSVFWMCIRLKSLQNILSVC